MVRICASCRQENSEWKSGARAAVLADGSRSWRGCGNHRSAQRIIVTGRLEGACKFRIWDELRDTHCVLWSVCSAWRRGLRWKDVEDDIAVIIICRRSSLLPPPVFRHLHHGRPSSACQALMLWDSPLTCGALAGRCLVETSGCAEH